jgi:hypothetical protein
MKDSIITIGLFWLLLSIGACDRTQHSDQVIDQNAITKDNSAIVPSRPTAQNNHIVEAIIPEFINLPAPKITPLPYMESCHERCGFISLQFGSFLIEFRDYSQKNSAEHSKVIFTRESKVHQSFDLAYPVEHPVGFDAYSLDVDQNGIADLYCVISPYYSTGIGTAAPRLACFLFQSDGTIDHHDLSSFYGDVDLFRDFNRDGKYEFALIEYSVTTVSNRLFPVHLFALRNGRFVNIQSEVAGFPALVEEIEVQHGRKFSRSYKVIAGDEILKREMTPIVPNVWNQE